MASTAKGTSPSARTTSIFIFGKKIDRVFAAAINFGVPLLTTEPFNFRNRHAFYGQTSQSFFHVLKFEGFDDGLYFFHDLSRCEVRY
jgi:hypothetical protein